MHTASKTATIVADAPTIERSASPGPGVSKLVQAILDTSNANLICRAFLDLGGPAPSERRALIEKFSAEHAYEILKAGNTLTLVETAEVCLLLIDKAGPDLAYRALRSIKNLTSEQRLWLIGKFNSENAYNALIRMASLSPHERASLKAILISQPNSEIAYRAVRDIKDLTLDDRRALFQDHSNSEYPLFTLLFWSLTPAEKQQQLAAFAAETAYQTLRDVPDLTFDERKTLIARLNTGYAFIVLRDINGLASDEKRTLIGKLSAYYAYQSLIGRTDLTSEESQMLIGTLDARFASRTLLYAPDLSDEQRTQLNVIAARR